MKPRRKRRSTAGAPFSLSSDDCSLLMREGLQYYHRYLSAFHLERYDLVERDTERNLRLFAFVASHAARQRDKIEFDQYRPYVQMMHTRARASQALQERRAPGRTRSASTKGSRPSADSWSTINRKRAKTNVRSCGSLIRWRREVERERPMGPLEKLEQQLELSVELEDYEEAARIRDQIRRLQEATRDSMPGASDRASAIAHGPMRFRFQTVLILNPGRSVVTVMSSGLSRRSLCHVRYGVILLANQRKTRREPISAPRNLFPRVPQVPT